MEHLIGALVRVFMKSGNIFQGVIREWNDKIHIVNAKGENFIIWSLDSIECVSYITDTKQDIIKEKKVQEPCPDIDRNDIKSLLAVRKQQAQEDLQEVKRTLTKTNTTQGTQYGDQLSVLFQTAKHSDNKGLIKKE